ncbi:2OG-Fe(II) oxygenase [Klebsiella michiganensis]|uniref:2OG-Fe(II) oxygenase n=1 Tax=Klebsiella michiganensis TaxID=1134687 RepID=UPI0032D9FDD4
MYIPQSIKRDSVPANLRNGEAVTLALEGRYVHIKKGDVVIFSSYYRPQRGTHSFYRVNMRHGVSKVHSGRRHTLGIIFHDAK